MAQGADIKIQVGNSEYEACKFVDEDHVWINGKQFISLKRHYQRVTEYIDDNKKLFEKIDELTERNKALDLLLKQKYTNE